MPQQYWKWSLNLHGVVAGNKFEAEQVARSDVRDLYREAIELEEVSRETFTADGDYDEADDPEEDQ